MAAPKIEKLLTPYNFTNKDNVGRIKYIVIHYVGALGGAKANCQYYASKYIGASAHYFVGFDGEIWQSVGDEDIAWHCGANSYRHAECRNSNSIGIELCVRNRGNQAADSKDWYFEDATVKAAIELTEYLMKKYGVDVANVIRHYDVTGKICPNPYVYNTTKHTWDAFKKAIAGGGAAQKDTMTKITGKAEATAEQMAAYIKAKNGSVTQSVLDMIPLYLSEGEAENIRGDIAFAQSCLETGNFTFSGSAVKLSQNNFCGMGVTKNGETGNSFNTPQLGIRAQIQHLKAYANTTKLKQDCIDPRFDLVSRGCAPYVEYLGIQENPKGKGWAAGAGYGGKILKILDAIKGAGSGQSGSGGQDSGKKPDDGGKQQAGFTPYLITTTCDVLNIRSGAGTGHSVVGAIREKAGKKNKYTIVEEKDGWGRLKSGAGWISLSYTKKAAASGGGTGFTPYLITTTCDVLNIRSGAGTGHSVVGAIREKAGKKNKYTIVEEKDGWGRLKSGAGWISLSYTKKAS